MARRLGTFLLARRHSVSIAVALAVGLLVIASGIGRAGDRWLADLRGQAMTRPMSGALLLVEIDSHSLARVQSWPWPRRLHAAMLDRLNAAGARQVAFDVDFSSMSDPLDDQALAQAIRRMPRPVILPGAIQRASTTSEVTVETMPIAPLRGNALLATNLSKRDSDDIVRRQPLWKVIEGLPRPSLAAALAGRMPGTGRNEFSFDLRFDPHAAPRISAIDLIEGRFDPAQVRGRQVLIGGTGIEVGDRVVLPRVGTIPGVFTHVMGFETLHAGTHITDSGSMTVLALTLLLGGIGMAARSRRVAGAMFGAVAVVLIAGPFAGERFLDLRVATVPSHAALATLLALRIAASIARSYRTGIATDARSGLPNALAMREEASLTGHADVAVARIHNLAEIRAVLDDEGTAELLRKICERLSLVAGDMRIFHTSDGAFAWLVRPDAVDELGERFDALVAIMASPIRTGARQIDVQMTYGMSTRQDNAVDALRTATVAAEQAAAQGQRWRAFSASDHDAMDVRMALIGELESAIDLGQIWVAYQPKYDLATRSITSAEALVRWLHPERGAIRPDHFIPLAEEHGRIAKLTRHVLDIALGDFSTLSTATHKPVVAVNLSAILLSAPNLVEMVCDALWRHGMLPHQLTLEVTESAAMSSDDAAIAALDTLRTMGIGVSIDDYGTGQSTLNYLKRLPATELKIDQSFIRAIADSRSDEILVASTIQLGHQLGMKVVAEGVETEVALRKLEAAGCDIVQGYLIAKPMPFTDFVRVYRDPPRIAA